MDCITPFWKQVWVVFATLIGMVAQGCVLGYTSCLLSALKAPDSPIKLDLGSASWLASILGLANVFGLLLSCFLMDFCGRRKTYLIAVLPSCIGWLMILLAENYIMLLIGRGFNGFGAGMVVGLAAIIIGEYTSPKYRGVYLNLKIACINLGVTFAHIVGSYVHWRTFAILGFTLYVISFVTAWVWPESPVWLASKKEFDKSKKAFLWLRGDDEYSQLELDEMIKVQQEIIHPDNFSLFDRVIVLLNKFTKKHFLKPVIISFASFTVIEAAGRHAFPAFAEQIIIEITGEKAQPHYHMLWIDIIITASALFSSIFVRLFNRRTVLFSSGISSLAVLTFGCSYLFLVSKNVISNDHPWIAPSSFVLYFILVNFGCTSIPLALQGEIFPLQHRSFGTAIAGLFFSANFMGCLHVTQYLLLYVNVHGTFAVFGCVMALMLVILYIMLPETKDRTLQEIEDYFYHGKFIKRAKNDDEQLKMMSQRDE